MDVSHPFSVLRREDHDVAGNWIVTRFAAFANLLRILVRPALPPKHPDLHTLWLQAGALPASITGSPPVMRYLELLGPLMFFDILKRAHPAGTDHRKRTHLGRFSVTIRLVPVVTEGEMLQVEDYEEMRRAYFCDEMSVREIAMKFHHGRNVVRKALAEAHPGRTRWRRYARRRCSGRSSHASTNCWSKVIGNRASSATPRTRSSSCCKTSTMRVVK